MATYSKAVHESSTHVFKLETSSLTDAVSADKKTLTVTLGDDTIIKNYNSGNYFDYHYKVFLVVQFTFANGDTKLVGADTIDKYSYVSNGTRVYSNSYTSAPTSVPVYFYKYEAPYLIAELDASTTDFRYFESFKASKTSFDIPIPEGAVSYLILFYGDSDVCYRYNDWDDGNGYQWHHSMKSCPCTDHVAKNESFGSIIQNISSGSITSITDNGDFTITVTGIEPAAATDSNNGVKKAVLSVTFSGTNSNGVSFTTTSSKTLIDNASGVAGGGNIDEDFTIPDGATTVYAALSGDPIFGMAICIFSDNTEITFGDPNPPTAISFSTAKQDKPRLKDDLTWSWSGATNGHNAAVAGYRVIIYKNNKNGEPTTAVKLAVAEDNWVTQYGAPYVETTNTSIVFNPITGVASDSANKFASKDRCYCRVFSYAHWGNAVHYSPRSLLGIVDSAGNHSGIIYKTGTKCTLHNSAVVWVKTDVDPTVNAGWQEGIPYVKTSDGWKEAESVHVKNSSTTWKEST